MKRHAALPMVVLFAACGGQTLDVGSQDGGGESGVVGGFGGKYGVGGFPGKGGSQANGGWGGSGGNLTAGATPPVSGGGSPGSGFGARPTAGGWTAAGGGTFPGDPSLQAGAPPEGGDAGVTTFTPIVAQECGVGEAEEWEGFTEDFSFRPLKAWHLALFLADDGRICGSATYVAQGEPAPLAPTDADAAYPPGIESTEWNEITKGVVADAWPGVTYSIIEGAYRDTKLHVRLAGSELWKDWCTLQKPHWIGDSYSCFPSNSVYLKKDGYYYYTDPMTLEERIVEPLKWNLCNMVCACSGTGCGVRDSSPIVFDLQRKSDTLITGVVMGGTETPTISLTRVDGP